jgi:hypothetical protein
MRPQPYRALSRRAIAFDFVGFVRRRHFVSSRPFAPRIVLLGGSSGGNFAARETRNLATTGISASR